MVSPAALRTVEQCQKIGGILAPQRHELTSMKLRLKALEARVA
jgi:hypothetical protein